MRNLLVEDGNHPVGLAEKQIADCCCDACNVVLDQQAWLEFKAECVAEGGDHVTDVADYH